MCGLVLTMLNYEHGIFAYDVGGIDIKRYPEASRHPRVTSCYSTVVRNVVLITTIVSIVCSVRREQLKLKWNNRYFNSIDKQHPSSVEFMHLDAEEDFMEENVRGKVQVATGSVLTRRFVAEILLMAFVPLPGLDVYVTLADVAPDSTEEVQYTYLLSEFMLAFMVLRMAFMFRAMMTFNVYNNPFSMKLFRAYG